MKRTEPLVDDMNITGVGWVLPFAGGIALGLWLLIWVLPGWLPGLSASLQPGEMSFAWFVSRGSAIIAYMFLWASMFLGLILSNKLSDIVLGGQAANELHRFISISGLIFSAIHGFILLGDDYLSPGLRHILVPFAFDGYEPFWVGVGQLGLYLWIIVLISFPMRKWMGRPGWRLVHYLSYLAFLLIMVHGILSGSDTERLGMFALYWASAGSILFLVVYRLIAVLFRKMGVSSTKSKRA